MIYEVSRFGYYTLNSGKIHPGWQSYYLCADSPEEAKAKALPVMDKPHGFHPREQPEVRPAQCSHHPRYKAERAPSTSCGVCHAMWDAVRRYEAGGGQG